jgi:hypothetical protein
MENKKVEPSISLNNSDLFHNKYSMDILEKNIDNLNKKILLYSQILNAEFCVKHILDMDIDSGSEDSYIFDKIYILNKQPHISEKEFDKEFKKYYCK